jgi:hypothetical protein
MLYHLYSLPSVVIGQIDHIGAAQGIINSVLICIPIWILILLLVERIF